MTREYILTDPDLIWRYLSRKPRKSIKGFNDFLIEKYPHLNAQRCSQILTGLVNKKLVSKDNGWININKDLK